MNDENFIKLIENFINICDNTSSDLSRHRDKLNSILNELNSIDFKYMHTSNIKRIIEDILKVYLKLPSNEDTIIIKTSHLCIQLIGKNSIPIPNHLFCRTIIFLIGFIQIHKFVGVCDVLRLMHILIKNQSKNNLILLSDASGELRETIYLLLELIDDRKEMQKTNHCHYEGDSSIEVKSSSIFCLETILSLLDQIPLIAASDDLLNEVSKVLIKLIFSLDLNEMTRQNYCVIMRSALSSCRHIGFSNKIWCNEHVGDLIGACVASMHFGTGQFVYEKPQKIQSSQQTVRDTQLPTINVVNKGGKTVKSRKIRQMPQYKHRKSNNKPNEDENQKKLEYSANNHAFFFDEIAEATHTSAFTTSESDTSDTESGRSNGLRDKEAKLRLAALSLLSVVGKNVEKKILFGYWHALFPSDNLTPSTISLLNCILCDTNNRCRMTALQAASLIFYGTKTFLIQAELTDKPPTSFMPFSIVLGNQIRVMYTTLTQTLANENSYAVLTQILKCLAVLIQSTTFQKMHKLSSILCELISYIKRLVHHKDSTIQVASLIVMEFLITGNETSNEITMYLGLRKLEIETNRRVHDYGEDEVFEPEENEIDLEYEDESEDIPVEKIDKNIEQIKVSWLLQIVLENFGVSVFKNAKLRQPSQSVQVRHQSLQVLLTMSSHFDWIKMQLKPISQALKNSMNDEVATVCQRSARCMDNIAHSISNALLNQSANKNPDFDDNVNLAIGFWAEILQNITEQLQSESVEGITKSVYCDALSDIGVCVYERLSRDKQILIISLLSGLSIGDEDPLVRASAVRALAIFVLFPSLREDICFIENTTEATLKILENDLIPVRIKASWALANITDALVSQIDDLKFERISDALLYRIFEMVKPICAGNDKIRTNVARILGNVLRLISSIHLTSAEWQLHCIDSIKLLSEQAKLSSGNSNMKVKWNACYAIGNFMKNSSIYQLDTKQFDWLANIYETLNTIIVNCANFKVRTNGAVALAIPAERPFYGEHYSSVWNACLVALYQANCFTDFNEYNHRDNLVDQLCITIAHLIMLATTNDFIVIENVLMQHIDSTKQNWIRVINRMVPEKAANLLAANLHLKNILSNDKLTSDVKNSLNVILDCFVSITEYND